VAQPAQPSPTTQILSANRHVTTVLPSTEPPVTNPDIDTWRDTLVIAALVIILGLLVLLLGG